MTAPMPDARLAEIRAESASIYGLGIVGMRMMHEPLDEVDRLRGEHGSSDRDLVAVASVLDGVEHYRVWLADAYDPDVPAPDPVYLLYRRAHELECQFGARLKAAGRPNTWGPS